MKLLLDTHIWLWSVGDPRRLARGVANAMESNENELWLSPLSVWEVLVLVEKGRVTLEPGPDAWFRRAFQLLPLKEAPLTHEVALETRKVQLPDRDPVDRLLAATARVFELTLVTADERLLRGKDLSTLANR